MKMRASSSLFVFFLILPYVIGELIPCADGKDGWFANDGYCYNFIEETKNPRTWQQAEDYCVTQLKSHLLSIASKEENDFIQSVMDAAELIKYPRVWIGLKATGIGTSFKWSDGLVLDYGNWNGNGSTPIPDTSTSCVAMIKGGKWGATHCNTAISGFICKKDKITIPPVTEPPIKQGECLSDWYKFNGRCYKAFSNKAQDGGGLDYDDALKSCQKLKSSLVTIHSQDEQDFLTARMGELGVSAWIGLKTVEVDSWTYIHQWIDNKTLNFVNWAPGEPSNIYGEPCVEMYELPNVGGKWNDVPCDKELGYICAKDVDPALSPVSKRNRCFEYYYGYQPYRKGCFRAYTEKSDFNTAQAACKSQGGNLASIKDTFDQAFLNSLVVNVSGNVWIGLSDTDEKKQGLFSWTDGWPVYYTKWAQDQPQAETLYKRCVSLTENNTWTVTDCTEKFAYLCKLTDATLKPPNITTIIGTCPVSSKANWKDVGNNYCYHIEYQSTKSWDEASRTCGLLGNGAKLASFHSAHELDVMRPLIVDTDNTHLWIGLLQDEDGGYAWQDGTPADYIPWDNGEPTKSRDEACVELLGHKMMYNNLECDDERGYICEVPKITEKDCVPGQKCKGDFTLCDTDAKCQCESDKYRPAANSILGKKDLVCEPVPDCVPGQKCKGNFTICDADAKCECESDKYRPTKDSILGSKDLICEPVIAELIPCTNGKDGWYGNDGYCYNFIEDARYPRTWQQAENYCVSQLKSHLLSVASKEENDFIQSVMDAGDLIKYPTAWIGLKATGIGASFKWSDGLVLDYINWNGNGSTPIPDTSTSCVVMITGGKWGATNCNTAIKGFICKKDNATIPPVTEPPIKQGECLPDWYKFNGRCYRPFSNKVEDGGGLDYDGSLKSCQKLKSSLVTIHSQDEQDFLTARMGELGVSAWIGLKTARTNGWMYRHQWIDNTTLNFVNWAPGEPSNPYGEPCVEMYELPNVGGKWNDVPCDKKLGYICAMDVDPALSPVAKPNTCNYYGYQPYRKGCYRAYTAKSDFKSAQDACKRQGGNLASINDTFDQAFINSLVVNITGNIWIGLSDTDEKRQGLFSWTDGWPVYYAKWAQDQPQAETLYNRCVSLTENNTWAVTNCTEKLAYLCKITDRTLKPPNITTIVGSCPVSSKANWKDVGNNYCYHVEYRNTKTWDEASRTCGLFGNGSKMASFHSAHELELMRPLIVDTDNTQLWIGLLQDEDGGYAWQDGTAADYIPWDNGEPTKSRYEACVELLGHKMKYNNLGCNQNRGYICEVPKIPGPTTPTPPITIPPRTDCGPEYKNWKFYNDSCYYIPTFSRDTKDWHEASEYCNVLGSHLVSIHTAEEDLFVASLLDKIYNFNSIWIGLSATGGERFEWVDETILDFDARSGDSNNAIATDKKCVYMLRYMTGRKYWSYDDCDLKKGFVCKREYGITPSTITPKPTTSAPGWCEDGWTRIGNKCAKIMGTDTPLNFTEASKACKAIGEKGNLLSILNQQEQDTVTTLLLDQTDEILIGLRKIGYGTYKWQDGSRLKFVNWAAGEPTSLTYENTCARIQSTKAQAGKWRADTGSCAKNRPYICQVSPSISVVTSPLPPTDCKEGFDKFSKSCFKLFAGEERKSWKEAENVCQRSGGHLASINSGLEQSFINTRLYSLNDSADSFWIGLSEDKRVFSWVDKWPIYYTNWGEFQPEISNATKKCVYLDVATRQWNATSCDDERNFICETTNEKPPNIPVIKNKVCPPRAINEQTDKNWVDPGTSSDYCYYVEGGKTYVTTKSWSEAHLFCLQNSAELVSFHNQHEIDILGPKLKDATKPLWIGLILKVEGEYGWYDNSPLDFEVWAKDEPLKNAYNPCVALIPGTGQWEVNRCNLALGFICRIQKIQSNETSTDDDPTTSESKTGLSGGGVAGLTIFIILALMGIMGGAYFYMKRRENAPQSSGNSTRKGVSFANDLYEPDLRT